MTGRIPHPWYGSPLWGVNFEGERFGLGGGGTLHLTREEQQRRLAHVLTDLSVAVFSEAQLAVYPQLFEDAKQLAPGSECLLHLNAMSVWARESVYWPRQNRLREWADADPQNRYLWRNGRIAEGWPGTRLLDVTRSTFCGPGMAWEQVCRNLPAGCDGYFLDEAHDSRGWLSPPSGWPSPQLLRGALRLQIRIASQCGRAPAWINGTAAPTPASPRRYIQNAGTMDPGYLLNVMLAACEAQPVNSRRILIQVDPRLCQTSSDYDFWSALAAIGDAGVEFNNPPWNIGPAYRWSNHRPGTWGHGTLDENDNPELEWLDDHTVGRVFDHAYVTVDLRIRAANVEQR